MNREIATEILKRLEEEYPEIKGTALRFENPFQLLVSTILSAQSTDSQVNKVTEKLFKKYRNVEDFAKAPLEELQNHLSSVGLYKSKSRYIKESATKILNEFGGRVPDSMEDLLKLPGVGRKTANVILSNAFRKSEGIAVDTHVMRLSRRIGLSEKEKREEIERDLMELYEKREWAKVSNLLIAHGRRVCKARKPLCNECIISELCSYFRRFKDELSENLQGNKEKS
jgi:endonuclease-3